MDIGVITNPNSGKNRGRPAWASQLQRVVGPRGRVHQTLDPAAIRPVLASFLRHDVRYLVSDGGDGALHCLLRETLALLDEPEFAGRALPVALPTNGGTIDFVAKAAGIRGDAVGLLRALRSRVEAGQPVETVTVDTMRVEGERMVAGEPRPLHTVGFAAAVAGVGQRFFSRYYEAPEPGPRQIVRVVARTIASAPVSLTPLRRIPGWPPWLRDDAAHLFAAAPARVTLDGETLPGHRFTAIHVASLPLDLGGVLRFFGGARRPGWLQAIVGAPTPGQMIANLPRMVRGEPMRGGDLIDAPCRELVVEAAGDELLAPVIDGEYYEGVRRVVFRAGPPLRLARLTAGTGPAGGAEGLHDDAEEERS